MFLPDVEIEKLLESGMLIKNWSADCITPNGYDLRIDEILVEGSSSEIVPPKTYFVVSSMEYIVMPDDIIGFLWLKSRWCRKGIVGSFGIVDAGYEGNLTLSAFNSSNSEVKIERGSKFVQIAFAKLISKPNKNYPKRSGNYYKSSGIKI